jgi:UDP-N-acetylmuramoyl-tripeptide--D-alanyl-D-alanine ligase
MISGTGAFAMALALGYSPEECVRGLEAAQSHARRLQMTQTARGVLVVDDCYNANPASMAAALETLGQLANEGRAVAVLGDMLELGAEEAQAHQQLGIAASDRAHQSENDQGQHDGTSRAGHAATAQRPRRQS